MRLTVYSYDHPGNPWCGGGGARKAMEVYRRVAAKHPVTVVTGKYPGATNETTGNLTIKHVGSGRSYLLSRLTYFLLANLHVMSCRADVIVVCFSAFSPVFAYLYWPKKTVVELYHVVGKEAFRKYGILGILPWLSERITLLVSRRFITLSDALAERLESDYHPTSVIAAYCGYDGGVYRIREKVDCRYVLYYGRLDIHMKGLDILLSAWHTVREQCDGVWLVIAGHGPESQIAALEKIASAGVHIMTGPSVDTDKCIMFNRAALVVVPSRYEGWCCVALEAGAAGKAVVGADITGLNEAVIHGKTGILVPPEDPAALARAIVRLLRDKLLRDILGNNGHNRARQFTWDSIADKHLQFLEGMK